ncbi:LuxR C-terminal-related transcriptional regulator [Nocardia bovistercoris]|uniref:Response regulator transcription factor n=1 Tax=Nocardia bovistercoris TaxID=2785916 RepID=A0A931IG97_9NOCA|nr:response regulator transcription factor [Nocardia bovistercoris]MBH0779851.1 response regulator transcription factor [Nocardia bovistercoris]
MTTPEPASAPRRIGLVEDHLDAMRSALCGFFRPHPDLELVAAASTVPELLAQTDRLDLVILDLQGLPDKSTPRKNIKALKSAGIENILVYTSRDRRYLVQEAGKAGVLGVVMKTDSEATVVEAIRLAADGQPAPSVDWAAALDADRELIPQLTPREREVLAMYASGDTAKDIAAQLYLAPETVRKYVMKIKDKYTEVGLEIHKKSEMRRIARRDGYIDE